MEICPGIEHSQALVTGNGSSPGRHVLRLRILRLYWMAIYGVQPFAISWVHIHVSTLGNLVSSSHTPPRGPYKEGWIKGWGGRGVEYKGL